MELGKRSFGNLPRSWVDEAKIVEMVEGVADQEFFL